MSRFRVDLRSDTVTKPSDAMRRAMTDAEVGDDWYDDDPTVNRLQERCAEVLGKEAAVFVPTGTMANQIGLRLHFSGPGHLVAAAAGLHVTSVEVMTAAALAGIAYRTVDPGPRGWIDVEQAAMLLEQDEFYDVEVVDLLAVENTVGAAGGRVMPLEELRAVRKVADDAGVPVHLDGARIFNAAVAAAVDAAEIAAESATMMFCLSKGLGAPIGSVLCGPADMAREARRLKILYGGAWRQAGIVAAAGLVALEEGPKRLHEDHARARRLAEGVAELLPGSVDLEQIETNMVFVDTEAVGLPLYETLDRLGVLGVGATHSAGKVRMVTHLDVDDAGIGIALNAWRELAAETGGSGGSSSERSARA
jgi:threonine aldolase